MRAMLPERLHGWVAEGLRAETVDQPAYVGHDLRAVSLRARAQRTRVTRLRQEATAALNNAVIHRDAGGAHREDHVAPRARQVLLQMP